MNTSNGGQQQNNSNNKQSGLSWSAPQSATPQKPTAPLGKPIMPVVPATKSTSSNGNVPKIVGWLAVGVVAGVVLAWGGTTLINKKSDTSTTSQPSQSSDTNSNTDTAAVLAINSDPSLLVMTPQKAGTSVVISKAIVSEPTWVVVYESRDGKPGNVLGAALFFAGTQSGTVELLRSTLAGKDYFVTKQTDNGDRKFSLKDDLLLTEDGQPMWVSFTAN